MNRFQLFFSFRYYWENWIFVMLVFMVCLFFTLIITNCISPAFYFEIFNPQTADKEGTFYLLSALVTTFGALLALSIPLIIVATQLAAQIYTPLIANFQYKLYYLWLIVICYLLEMAYCAFLIIKPDLYISYPIWIDSAFAFGLFCIFLLLPFLVRTFKLLIAEYMFQYLALRIAPDDFTEPADFTTKGIGGEGVHLRAYYEILERLVQDGRFKSAVTGIKTLEDTVFYKLRTEWMKYGTEKVRIICDNLSKNIWYLGRTACARGQIEVLVRLMAMCRQAIDNLLHYGGGEHSRKFYDTMLQMSKDIDTFFTERAEVFRDYFITIRSMEKDAGEALAERFLKFEGWDGVTVDRRRQLEKSIAELEQEVSEKGKGNRR
jgi:hypothetical protein